MEKLLQEQIELTQGDIIFFLDHFSQLNKESDSPTKDLMQTKERIIMLSKRLDALHKKLESIRKANDERDED